MPLMPAVLGSARLGNFRLGYRSAALQAVRETRARITIAGVEASTLLATRRVRIAGLSIHDVLNDAPNTAAMTVQGLAPAGAMDVRITINSDDPQLLFNGTLQTDDLTYEGLPSQLAWPATAVDDLVRLNRRRPFGTWVNTSVTTIAQYLIATFAPGFTSANVQAGLPLVTITFDGSDSFGGCLAQLAKAIGGYFYVEDLDLHLFQAEVTDPPDDLDHTPGRFLNDPPITVTTDTSQLRTRLYGKGHGEPLTVDVAAGETIVPVVDTVMFNPAGGQAIAGTTPDGAQSQILAYAGVQQAGGGSLVGPGVTPSVAPVVEGAIGTGIEVGVHQWAYTWVTASGETLPSPLKTVTMGAVTAPSSAWSGLATAGFGASPAMTIGATYKYVFTWGFEAVTDPTHQTAPSPVVTVVPINRGDGIAGTIQLLSTETPPPGVHQCVIYRTLANGATYYRVQSFAAPNFPNFNTYDSVPDSAISGNPTLPAANFTLAQAALSGLAIGPAGTTQRKVYRTATGLSQLKLQQTIANNTATVGVQDATADASLGANVPTSDTSGLVLGYGQVNAGSTSLPTAGAGAFSAGGGWVLTAGGDVVRYTGVSGNTLTGIPSSGPGSITVTIPYTTLLAVAPALTGVTGVLLPMLKGTPVHIWVQRDDLAAQAAMAAIDLAQGRVSDGVYEHKISDERRGEDSLMALCDAELALFSRPIVTVTYDTRDVKTKSGKTIHVELTTPPIGPIDLTIQDVTITEIDIHPGTPPRFHVTASSVRFSLEDILRRLIAGQAAN